MKGYFIKITAIFLTLAVVFSTTSFAADMHFCCNTLVNLSVTGKAKPCDAMLQILENTSTQCSIGQKDCCSNQTYINEGSDNLKKVSFELDLDKFVFLTAFVHTYINLFEGLEKNFVPFTNYDPPWIEKDLLVLHETFLI